ncbi:MAG: NAD-dependent epimerase/dehydratase family protein, partial [Pirellulaceae bacterium]
MMQASKPKVLVTGSSGFIGTAVIRRLAPDYELVGFDVQEGQGIAGADFIQVDISENESVLAGLQEMRNRHGDRLASVVHLAAYYDFSGEPSTQYENITVRGTQRLLQGLQRNFHVEQFLFSSTMLVHAPAEPGQKINEHWPLAPKWDYPESKVRTEELLRAQHGDIPIVLARIAGIYDDHCHSIPLANQIQRIRERWMTSQVYPGDLSRGQAFLHLDDLVEAIAHMVERRRELPSETTVLLGEPETLSYGELQQEFGRLIHNEEWATRHVSKTVAKTGAWLQDHL